MGGEGELSPEVSALLAKLKGKDWKLILATGRDRNYVEGRGDVAGVFDCWVLENGVEVYVPSSNASHVHLIEGWEELRRQALKLPFTGAKKWTFHFPRNRLREVERLVKSLGIQTSFKDNRGILHALPAGVDKGVGVLKALEMLKVEGWIAALGDAMVDLDLFRVADFKAAVGNAEETVKKKADYIAEKPDGEGALEILKKLVEGSLP
ncbi:TPA: hypothetical protein EYP27_06735 [Candidatus Bathyarchaeota archaeon]|nr:hypothetical protein [Candidatus Bathyarchaeota archaeon]